MEQYIQDWLKEHPEARVYVESAWRLGYVAGVHATFAIDEGEKPATTCPFVGEPNEWEWDQEVKAA